MSEADFDLSDRAWARGCSAAGGDGSLSDESFDVTAAIQDIVGNQNWVSGNALVLCFLDNGSRGKNRISSAISLTAAFSASGEGPAPGDGPLDCSLDTNGDGFDDLDFSDVDEDGYCDFPAGTVDFLGTLGFDRPFEVTGTSEGGGGAIFRGSQIRLVGDGNIISDFQSPTLSTEGFENGLVLTLSAESNLSLIGNGMVSNLGLTADEAGDLLLSTSFPNARISISGPLILAEDIQVKSNGSVDIDGQTVMGAFGNVRIEALQSDGDFNITLAGETDIFTSNTIFFRNDSPAGKLSLGDNIVLSAKTIDFCGVAGGSSNIQDLGADLRGTVIMPGDPGCSLPPAP